MPNGNRLLINIQAIKYNLECITKKLPLGTQIMPMVKASAYGTDAIFLAQLYQKWGIKILGVSHVAEGIRLREAGIHLPIFVIKASTHEFESLLTHNLEVSISSAHECRLLHNMALLMQKPLYVHLYVNTGMNRFGASLQQVPHLVKRIHSLPFLRLKGIMSHFVAAEDATYDTYSQKQIAAFYQITRKALPLPPYVHLANSAGVLRFTLPFCNMARVGIALLGFYSSKEERKALSLQPSLTLESYLCSVQLCKKGETVGYKYAHLLKRNSRIGILPIGYHDGILNIYAHHWHVNIGNQSAPIIGKICMDFMMVDITHIPQAKEGTRVELFGKDLPLERIAEKSQTNIREILTCLGPRIQRHFFSKAVSPSRQKQQSHFKDFALKNL